MKKSFEAIVIGGGHAGVEAAFAVANKNHDVLLITLDKNRIASMPCNPSIGGPAKGILTREIDALGGVQGYYSDKAMIQIKMLNQSKGPAVRALRAQIDKLKYSKLILEDLLKHPHVTILEAEVDEIISQNNQIKGVKANNKTIETNKVIVTTGTYLKAFVFKGDERKNEGPSGQKSANNLSISLKKLGFVMQRLKTGTPPRIFASSIDFSEVEKEILPLNDFSFSNRSNLKLKDQVSCYLTYTNEETHKIINENIKKSSLYSGLIDGIGPRYCPSIEDKVLRFSHKERHQIFYEPETIDGSIIYVNGLSTSMPSSVQDKIIRTLPGMKNAKVSKWGYAIEYDAINSLDLKLSLESKKISGLYFAGQINGSSGYEEAAAQGLIAGINIALNLENKKPLILKRSESYIGVLIDDLMTKGTKEPYRMLTSRAEYRLLLRNDNAHERLIKYGYQVGLVSQEEYDQINKITKIINDKILELNKTYLSSKSELAKKYKATNGRSLASLMKMPEVIPTDILPDFKYLNQLVTKMRLAGYIKKQETTAKRLLKIESFKIPANIDYSKIQNIATEAREKLEIIRPINLGQASRISGINPADIQMIIYYLRSNKNAKKS